MSNETEMGTKSHIRRSLVRTDTEVMRPFLPYGLLPILGLVAVFLIGLFPFATSVIEGTVKQVAADAKQTTGADWADITVSGQQVTINGDAPNADALANLRKTIREDKRKALLVFSARPVSRIKSRVIVLEPTDAPPGKRIIDHNWSYTLNNGVLTLNGTVPDLDLRVRLQDQAELRLDPERLTDIRNDLVVTDQRAKTGYSETAQRGINTLSRCQSGIATFENETFSLACEAKAEYIEGITLLADAPLLLGTVGAIDVYSTQAASACNQSFQTLLATARIEFATASSSINQSSAGLLDRIAEAAKACPGRLRIEGHTDNSGLAAFNDQLSLERAQAVQSALVARGVPGQRLVTFGYGDRRPIVSNDTADGRAQNRRIEIRILGGSE